MVTGPRLTDVEVPPLPDDLQVEVTSACNLRCAMCLVRYRPPVNKLAGAMPLDMFQRLVDDLPGLARLTLQGLGEPLLAPHLLDMIRYAKARGARVGFNSNATLLHDKVARDLVATGLDWLHVSLDGADPKTFEAIREGARFDRVVANLVGLVAAKRAAGTATPWIRVVFVAMRRNVDQLAPLVRLLGDIGVSEIRVQNLSHTFSDTDPAGDYQEIRRYAAEQALWTGADRQAARRAFAQAQRAAQDSGVSLRLPDLDIPADGVDGDKTGDETGDKPRDKPRDKAGGQAGRSGHRCTWPWDAAYVTSSGVVQPCCMVMGDDRVTLGNLAEQSFAQIWAGPAYQEFRRRLAGDDPPEVCRGCAVYQGTF